ncbi:MAG: carboxylating nicotinate-nucleotide diphosphorylase [Balneolaceae bacterium]
MNRETGVSDLLTSVLEEAFREDIGFGDITSQAISQDQNLTGIFTAKQPGTVAGMDAVGIGYRILDPSVKVTLIKRDGDPVAAGDPIATVEGPADVLLAGERVILNLLQHLSGIATAVRAAVRSMEGSPARICDTRKTIPGLRGLQKYAVRCGGGYNHRLRLDHGAMIKDNHIVAAGGIQQAVEAVRNQCGLMVKLEVECETEEEIREAVRAGADIIMLDNRTPDEVRTLRKLIPDTIIIEVSGGITPETAATYRDCGADYISIGSLTHSVIALDISFNLKGGKKLL